MNTRFIAVIIFVLVLAAGGAAYHFRKPAAKPADIKINQSSPMKIISSAFEENASIPAKYTCDGENINPPLAVSGVPVEAKSLALILDDPDAPSAGGFVHWVVFNFDPKTIEIAENSVPAAAVQSQNGAGQARYTGPCPPTGAHHYHFRLYALDSALDLDSSVKREDVEQAMAGHILNRAELVGLYERP